MALYYYEMRGGRKMRLRADRDLAIRYAEQAPSDSKPFHESTITRGAEVMGCNWFPQT